ncbi:hypothetical protein B0H14DRAFT_3166454 [Mycena olivaceomarginata]|nr:hypothetical protein B0H14DRAFT_3166454 [Mycena olivaceomarginata]
MPTEHLKMQRIGLTFSTLDVSTESSFLQCVYSPIELNRSYFGAFTHLNSSELPLKVRERRIRNELGHKWQFIATQLSNRPGFFPKYSAMDPTALEKNCAGHSAAVGSLLRKGFGLVGKWRDGRPSIGCQAPENARYAIDVCLVGPRSTFHAGDQCGRLRAQYMGVLRDINEERSLPIASAAKTTKSFGEGWEQIRWINMRMESIAPPRPSRRPGLLHPGEDSEHHVFALHLPAPPPPRRAPGWIRCRLRELRRYAEEFREVGFRSRAAFLKIRLFYRQNISTSEDAIRTFLYQYAAFLRRLETARDTETKDHELGKLQQYNRTGLEPPGACACGRPAAFRCDACGDTVSCQACLMRTHALAPNHVIQVIGSFLAVIIQQKWTGYWRKIDLRELGLVLHLGHHTAALLHGRQQVFQHFHEEGCDSNQYQATGLRRFAWRGGAKWTPTHGQLQRL